MIQTALNTRAHLKSTEPQIPMDQQFTPADRRELIEQGVLLKQLIETMKDDRGNNNKIHTDHETRLRDFEKFKYLIIGANGAITVCINIMFRLFSH